jgi:hypothetical protein
VCSFPFAMHSPKCYFQLSANFEGFQLVLIADIHEQPELHLRVQPFSFSAKDWSAEVCLARRCIMRDLNVLHLQLRASTAFDVRLNYWNLTNSRWEPRTCWGRLHYDVTDSNRPVVIDPWKFGVEVRKAWLHLSLRR